MRDLLVKHGIDHARVYEEELDEVKGMRQALVDQVAQLQRELRCFCQSVYNVYMYICIYVYMCV